MKCLGYWGCNYENSLISDIAQHYGDNLQNMTEIDQTWLLGRLCQHYWMRWLFTPPTEAAEEVRDRLEELPKHQLGWLIQALGNKSSCKSLGYYCLDYEIPLINNIYEHYGDKLQNMNEVDQVWLIGMMGDFYYQIHIEEDVSESDAADEVRDRLYQLDQMNCGALIHALTNK